MGKQPTVADYIVRRLAREGITDCFGVAGDFAFKLCDAVARSEAIRWVGCSNELDAAYAADSYARVRGCYPHGLSDEDFDILFTKNRPIIFAFHGYPSLIHGLTYRRTNHRNLQVRGYKEEGTTTTPFDMVVLNDLDRFHLVMDVIDRLPLLRERAAYLKQALRDKLIEHRHYVGKHGDDMPEVAGWRWGQKAVGPRVSDTEADNV